MDNVILDVLLGLILIYLALGLLVTKLQETLIGHGTAARTRNLHDMLIEAVGHNQELKKRVLQNPLIFSLFKGSKDDVANKSRTGPSAIPPDLFAKALLIELFEDGKGKHPSTLYSPDEFVGRVGAGKSDGVWGSLRALLSGHEGDWSGFELAIADWFKAIGDRADGWYQKNSQFWSLLIAFGVAIVLNIDSVHIADCLANDPSLRRGLSTLAQNLNVLQQDRQRASDQTTVAKVEPPAIQRAENAIRQASALIHGNYVRQPEFAKFDVNAVSLTPKETGAKSGGKEANEKTASQSGAAASQSSSGAGPTILDQCQSAGNFAVDAVKPTRSVVRDAVYLSNPVSWIYLLHALQSTVNTQGNDSGKLKMVRNCLGALSPWVEGAASAANDPASKDNLDRAAVELNRARLILTDLLEAPATSMAFTQLFLQDPANFLHCAKGSTASRDSLRQCIESAQDGRARLPFGWGAESRRLAYCQVAVVEVIGSPAAASAALDSAGSEFSCGLNRLYEGNSSLGIPGMVLRERGWFEYLATLFGWALTALFVSLGAPFWFDLLGKVVKLRAAGGKAREDALTSPEGARAPSTSRPPGDIRPGDNTEVAPFALARNDLEKRLTASDIIALQGALRVTRTGVFDQATRDRLAEESQTRGLPRSDELTNQLYWSLLGRMPAGMASLQPPTSGLVLRAPDSRCEGVAKALMAVTEFQGRISLPAASLTDDLRALGVLWRYKKDGATPPHARTVASLAKTPHALDGISAQELADITKDEAALPASLLKRDAAAPWMDWAIGELGQAEAQSPAATAPAASNPRIVEYLEAGGKSGDGESTAWCACFASWVLKQHFEFDKPVGAQAPIATALAAGFMQHGHSIWDQQSGTPLPAQVKFGDVVLIDEQGNGIHHVGFVIEAQANGVYALSGNWSNRVGIDFFAEAKIHSIRR